MRRRPYGCGIEAALAVVGGKWKPIVLWHLSDDPRRFSELRRQVTGISEKMLIQQPWTASCIRTTPNGRHAWSAQPIDRRFALH